MRAFLQDLRYALRGLRAKPAFTAAVIVTLGLGIGANAARFGIVDRLLYRAPPFLHDIATVNRVYVTRFVDGKDRTTSALAYRRYRELASTTTSFSKTAAFFPPLAAVGIGEEGREMVV